MKRTTHSTSFLLFILLALFLLYFSRQKQLLLEKEHVAESDTRQKETQHMPKSPVSHSARLPDERQQKKAATQKYTIKNSITQEMLTYKHWSGSYAPSTFAVSMQGAYIQPGETVSVLVDSGMPITIRYDYSFMNGYRTGSREIAFMPLHENGILDLTFSWHDPTHVLLKDAKIVGETVLPFNTSLEKKDSNNIGNAKRGRSRS